MKYLKQRFEYAIYGYDPVRFMPIRRDNRLVNRHEFFMYKLERVLEKFPTPVK